MDIAVTRRDEAFLLAVKGVAGVKFRAASIAMFRYLGGINVVS